MWSLSHLNPNLWKKTQGCCHCDMRTSEPVDKYSVIIWLLWEKPFSCGFELLLNNPTIKSHIVLQSCGFHWLHLSHNYIQEWSFIANDCTVCYGWKASHDIKEEPCFQLVQSYVTEHKFLHSSTITLTFRHRVAAIISHLSLSLFTCCSVNNTTCLTLSNIVRHFDKVFLNNTRARLLLFIKPHLEEVWEWLSSLF